MENRSVLFHKQDQVGIITFNRPHRLNAINADLLHDFIHWLQAVRDDVQIKAAVLTGAGRAFCAGEDLKETAEGKTFDQWVHEIDGLQKIQKVILELGKPLIAAIPGHAVGGGLEFALSCDIRIAAPAAIFGFPETGVGLTVTTAGTKLISQIVGLGKAKELILTGEFIDADQALAIGLVNHVVPAERLMDAALEMCAKITRRSALALRLSRIAIDQGLHAGFEQTLEIEAAHMLACINSPDQQDRVKQKLTEMQTKR